MGKVIAVEERMESTAEEGRHERMSEFGHGFGFEEGFVGGREVRVCWAVD